MTVSPASDSGQIPQKPEATLGTHGSAPRGRWMVWVALFSLLAVLGMGLVRRASAQVDRGPAPDFDLVTFSGETIGLGDLRGNVVVVNFWASWCTPCRQEAPILEATWRAYRGRGVIFIGVDWVDTEKEALAYIDEFEITYPNGPDLATRIAQAYRIQGVPETFFVDRTGMLRGIHIGPLTEQALVARIEALLAEVE